MWLLESDGTLGRGAIPEREIAGSNTPDASPKPGTSLTIRFEATQDGRGFSVARRLRLRGHRGRLVAAGPLEPDQARHAFASGFDAVAIEDATLKRHGRSAWANALANAVTTPYLADPTSRIDAPSIWASRHPQV